MKHLMVTYSLTIIMIIISLASMIWPSVTSVLGGVGELSYPWQPWTAVFVHGWPGMPILVHLIGNLVLLAVTGPGVERQLGFLRFLTVTLLAIFAAGIVRLLTGVEFNGASAFIWAYAPLLWFFNHKYGQTDKAGILYVMWLIVPLGMGIIFVLNGVDLFTALVLGNVYHLSGTLVGFCAVRFWKERLNVHDTV